LWVRAASPAAWPPAAPGPGREPRPVRTRPATGASPSGSLAARLDGPPGTGALGASRPEPTAERAGRPGVDGPGGARPGLRVRTATPVELPPCHRGRPGLAGPALEPAASPDPRLGPPSPPGCPLGSVAAAPEPPEGPRPPAVAPAEAEALAPPDGQADPAAPDAAAGLLDRRAGAAARNEVPVAAGAVQRDRTAERAAEPLAPRATGPERVRTPAWTPTGPALELGWCAGPKMVFRAGAQPVEPRASRMPASPGPIAAWRPGSWRWPRRRRRPPASACRRPTGRPAGGGGTGALARPSAPLQARAQPVAQRASRQRLAAWQLLPRAPTPPSWPPAWPPSPSARPPRPVAPGRLRRR
jgi:DNA polymerase-3 subunit gamma/tau